MKSKSNFVFVGVILLMILSYNSQANDIAGRKELVLSGNDWIVTPFEPGQGEKAKAFAEKYQFTDFSTAFVPGDVHWDMERAGKIPYLYYGMNSKEAGWVIGKEWWYQKKFDIDKKWQQKSIRLRFEAVDYLADVWLNGNYLGKHEGQFTPFEFEVDNYLHFNKANVLTVMIHPAPIEVQKIITANVHEWQVMNVMRPAYPYWKSMTSSGWDWGCDLLSMGIWQDVSLIASNGVYLSNVTVLPDVDAPFDKATLRIRINTISQKTRKVELVCNVRCITANDSPAIKKQQITLQTAQQTAEIDMKVLKPNLWWPNGYGQQHLYELTVTANDPITNTPLDQATTRFGIRKLKILENPNSPEYKMYRDWADGPKTTHVSAETPSRRYLMEINGRRIYGKGSNWIPCDMLFGRADKNRYEHLIRLANQANINLFRIWGGGLLEKQVFFDLCEDMKRGHPQV